VEGGKSLLAAGIVEIEGDFAPKDAVILCTAEGTELARGLVNYGSADLRKIRGHHSDEIPSILGYASADTVVHRDNLVLANQYRDMPPP
jgi:glutamate 5-kinase